MGDTGQISSGPFGAVLRALYAGQLTLDELHERIVFLTLADAMLLWDAYEASLTADWRRALVREASRA